jgi:hypothetical protein
MSRVVKVNQGDYIISTQYPGNIVLDTGATGTTTITGNLTVVGTSTQINTTNLNVSDNIIILNQGESESHDGVSVGTSGIEINRGALNDALILWNESVNHYDPLLAQNVAGTFVFSTADSGLTGIQASTIVNGVSNLMFDMQNSSYVLRVANSPNYSQNVLDSNDIPNRKFVTDYVSATGGTANASNIHYPLVLNGGTAQASVTTTSTSIDLAIGGYLRARVTTLGVAIDNIFLASNTITNTSSSNLRITATNNNVEVKSILNLDNLESLAGSYDTTSTSGTTKIYTTAAEGPGRTGIHFVNNTTYGGNSYNSDELVSKNRAVLLSILL